MLSDFLLCLERWKPLADWLVAVGTLSLGFLAVFGDRLRDWLFAPRLVVTCRARTPDCALMPILYSEKIGAVILTSKIGDALYVRLWIENRGWTAARNVEVFAKSLRRARRDETWEDIGSFPRMNLGWTHTDDIYMPRISRKMGRYCDLGRVAKPADREKLGEGRPDLELGRTSFVFGVKPQPSNLKHIVGPGTYEVKVLVAAENVRPVEKHIKVRLDGAWYDDEDQMLRDGIGVGVV